MRHLALQISYPCSKYNFTLYTRTVNSLCLKWNDMTLNDMLFHLCRTKERLPLCSVSVIWLNYLVQNFHDYSKLLSNITFAPVEHWNHRFNSLGQIDATQYMAGCCHIQFMFALLLFTTHCCAFQWNFNAYKIQFIIFFPGRNRV